MRSPPIEETVAAHLCSAKRIGDLHAFSVDSDCIRFGPGDCSFTLSLQNRGFPTGLWTLSRLLIRAEVSNAPCTLEPTQQGLSPPRGRGREQPTLFLTRYAKHWSPESGNETSRWSPCSLLSSLAGSVSDSDVIVAGFAFILPLELISICMLCDNWPVIWTGMSQ